jgi:large subunit ribosomal protein L10
MPKTRQQKEVTVQELSALLKTAKSLVFASYEKLPVKEIETLRRSAREQGVAYAVAKKTLLARAMRDAGYTVDPKDFAGNFATLLGLEDEVAPAKLVAAFAKEHEAMKIVGGVLEKKAMDTAAVVALATLPSKQQLLGQLVGTLQAPISGFANVLAGNIRGLATVLTAIKEAKA